MTATVKVCQPHVLGKAAILKFCRAVIRGNEVSSDGLYNRVLEAPWIAIVSVDGVPVGCGALKYPTAHHRLEIADATGISMTEQDYRYELGWIVIDPSARGKKLSRLIVQALLDKAGTAGVFCTVRADNYAIQKACDGYGFADTGARWKGASGNELGLGLWRAAA